MNGYMNDEVWKMVWNWEALCFLLQVVFHDEPLPPSTQNTSGTPFCFTFGAAGAAWQGDGNETMPFEGGGISRQVMFNTKIQGGVC